MASVSYPALAKEDNQVKGDDCLSTAFLVLANVKMWIHFMSYDGQLLAPLEASVLIVDSPTATSVVAGATFECHLYGKAVEKDANIRKAYERCERPKFCNAKG
jgi:hypothetical protein